MNKLWINLIILVVLLFGTLSQERVSAQTSQLKDYLPTKVNLLREFLSETYPSGKTNLATSDNKYIRRAKEQAIEWVMKTINKEWLPLDPNILREKIIMIQNAFGPNDVTYFQWEKNNHIVQVAETQTIMLIQVRTTSPSSRSLLTVEDRKLLARNTILGLLNSEVNIEVIEPTTSKTVKKIIRPELLGASFDRAVIREYTDGIHSKCSGPIGQRDSDYNFWWRRIGWWTEGRVLGLYTLKTEGGAWEADYDSKIDETWFEGPAPKKQIAK